MYWSSWPASEGTLSICEMELSPWQPLQTSAFSLTSAAWAPAMRTAPTAVATNRLRISPPILFVIAGLDPAIHQAKKRVDSLMDARVKPGHDDLVTTRVTQKS